MKLKKILVLGLFLGIVLCPNVSIAKDYACEFDNGGYYRYSPDISDEEYKQRCETYKNPFWGEKRQQLYENCLRTTEANRKFYNEGNCKPLLKKTHTKGKTKCEVDYFITKSNKKKNMGTACMGPDIENLKKEIENLYD